MDVPIRCAAADGKFVSGTTLDGAKLTAGKQYSLVGQAVFGKGGSRSSVKTSLTFRPCASA